MLKTKLIREIEQLKKEKNAVILAHCYQNIEIDEVADFVGDSLFLSQQAATTNSDIIVFAGVYFMAETAKILSPEKKVILPRLEAGCLMADMINLKELRKFKKEYPSCPVICYVNSTAEIKAESDICCTSANAVEIVKSLPDKKILFVPDRGLGTYVATQVPEKEIVSYMGYCPTHMRILPEDIMAMKNYYPDAEVMAHPECHMEVIKLADYVGSTSGIIKRAKSSSATRFIIATEKGVIERLRRDIKDKQFIHASTKAVCENMKWNTLEDILYSLKTETPEVNVSEDVRTKAYTSINRMLSIPV